MMIFIKNRQLALSCAGEEHIGFVGDHETKTVTFCLPSTEFSDYSFRLDLEKETGEKGIAYLTKSVQENRILLFWKPQASQLSAGLLRAQIRAFLTDGEEVWHTEQLAFYVGESIEASEAYPAVLPSEFTEIEERIAAMDERISANVSDGQALYEKTAKAAELAAANANSAASSSLNSIAAKKESEEYRDEAKTWAQKSQEYSETSGAHSKDAEGYAEEAKAALASIEKGADGISPIAEIVPRENSNAYRMTKKALRMCTVRWCDNADGDEIRQLDFSAKVECHAPYASHAWRIQVRKADGSDADLMRLGSDGAGNTVLYNALGERMRLFTPGWHEYSVFWNSNSGNYMIVADGATVVTDHSDSLAMTDAHGLQITGFWGNAEGAEDTISIDYFTLYGSNSKRFSDDFNASPIGEEIPENWYKNDSYSENMRDVFLVEDKEVYLVVTDAEGTKKSGNIKGEDASLGVGSVTADTICDGAVGMEKLSSEVRALLEQVASLTASAAAEGTDENGVG